MIAALGVLGIVVFIGVMIGVSIVLRRERWLDKLGRGLFLNREVQSGDTALDDQIYIETDEEDQLVKRVLEPLEARNALLDAVQHGRAVTLSKEGVGGTVFFHQK